MVISKDDLLSIKHFSKLTGIKQSTLRYYDDLGLFSPSKRGENGYRYYSPQQIVTINSIDLLHKLDMPIRQISEIQSSRTPETMLTVLDEKEQTLEAELRELERSYDVVHTLKRLIQLGLSANEDVIETRYLEDLSIVIGPENDFGGSEYYYDAFVKFCGDAKQYRIDLRFPVGGMFDDFETFARQPAKPNYFFSVDPKGLDKRHAGTYVSGFTRGNYRETGNLLGRMQDYIKKNALKTVGPVYNIFLHDELSVDNPDNYLMQATVEVV